MILEYQGHSCVSLVIRFFSYLRFWSAATKKYSHTSWSFATIQNGYVVGDKSEYESWPVNGVEHVLLIGMNHIKGTRIDLYELRTPLTRIEMEAGMLFMSAQIGKKYDWWGIFGMLIRRKTHDTDRWFCSELVFEFLRMCGRTILQYMEAYQIVPGAIPTSPDVVYRGYILCGDDMRVHQDIEKKTGLSGMLKQA